VSLGIIVKGPEGLALAAESRVTLTVPGPGGGLIPVNFDNATKLLSFGTPNSSVGAVTYGQAGIGLRTAASFLPELETTVAGGGRLAVPAFAQQLSDFFMQQWQNTMPMPPAYTQLPMTFLIGGFDENDAYGRVFIVNIPYSPTPVEVNPGVGQFGISWGGQREYVDRLIQGYDVRVPEIVGQTLNLQPNQQQQLLAALQPLQMGLALAAMSLQDCVDLAIFFIRTTMEAQRLSVGIRGVGGPIDVATITRREGFRYIQRKRIVGERQTFTTALEEAE
jgi:hypothetical protein